MPSRPALAALIVSICVAFAPTLIAGSRAAPLPPPAPVFDPTPEGAGLKTIVLAGGCFWGVQGVFEHVRGVREAVSGYAGGRKSTAHYEMVSTGMTGHAESVRVVYDPKLISLGRLLQIYVSVATDPTQLNRQFPDEGPQYRGVIFYTDANQKQVADQYLAQLAQTHAFSRPIVTKVEQLPAFYPAEEYHQDYLLRHPQAPYIAIYDLPKIAALKTMFPNLFRADPVRAS